MYMNLPEARYEMVRREVHDLMDFNNYSLTESGELRLPKVFSRQILLELGNCVLELSRIGSDDHPDDEQPEASSNLYVFRNLSSDSPEAQASVDDTNREYGQMSTPALGDVKLLQGDSLVIGRETTPELDLPKSVSREHMLFSVDNVRNKIKMMDLYSTNGTKVYLDPRERCTDEPTRMFHLGGPPKRKWAR